MRRTPIPSVMALGGVALASLGAPPAKAHFGLILPERAIVAQEDGRSLPATFAFLHPFEQFGMPLDPPAEVRVIGGGAVVDLTDQLEPMTLFDEPAFSAEIPLDRPGAYTITMVPEPYWEPSEDSFIIHYTKTVVSAYGGDDGWDTAADLPTEIIPLTRPFGLWEGNLFQGIVMIDGAPAPYAEVEIEPWNTGGVAAPGEVMITQTVKADGNGVFSYAPPAPGWWGFAALSTADYRLPFEGAAKPVELGAVIWVHFENWP